MCCELLNATSCASSAGVQCAAAWLQRAPKLLCWRQASPHDADCNVPGALRLRGPLAEAALTGALALVLQRHDALRARIVASPAGGAQVQVRRRRPSLNVGILRVSGSPWDGDSAWCRLMAACL